MLYLGYYSSPWSDYWLGMTCSKESAGGQFLATWGHSLNYPDYKINLTSLFCETNYYKQAVNATVSSVDYVPLEDSVVPLGPRERIEEKEFNITAFERLISSGLSVSDVTPALQEKVVRDYPFEHLLEQHQQVADLGVMWPMTPMTGFAIGSHKNVTSLEFFRDEAVLGEAFNSTHKMLFNLALRRVLDNVTVAGLSEGNVDFILHGIIVSRLFSAIVESFLAVGLGGLFNEEPIAIEHPHEFQQSIMPRLNNESVYNFSNPIAPYEIPFLITMNNVTQNTPLTRWVSHEYFFQPFKVIPNDTAPANTYSARTTGFGVNPSCSDMGTFKTRGNTPEVNYTITRNGEAVQGCPSSFTTKVLDLNTTIYKDLTGQASAEYVSIMNKDITDLTICQVPVMFGWSRSAQAANKTGEMETWAVVCDPVFTTAMFDVTVDSDGYVISSSQVSESSPTLDYPLSTNHTDMMITIINSLFTANKNKWHNDTFARDWINYLLKIQPGHADLLDPKSTPDIPSLIPDLEALYRQIYVLALGNTQQNLWETYPEPLTITGIRHVTETRIFMNTTALAISLAVLGINIAVAIALYGLAIKHFLPRMPTTIGSILAYLAPSRAVREYDGPGSLQSATFSFGRYVAEDGRAHVGIELDPFVVPVKLSALRKGDTEPRNGLLRRILGRRKVERGDETWL
ncbi:hypothetical protein Brms1b_001753 [Colletotrichum noveboracense]|nr:hypothetical protein Brms1b_001753 [Colletotrichum noveboracense]